MYFLLPYIMLAPNVNLKSKTASANLLANYVNIEVELFVASTCRCDNIIIKVLHSRNNGIAFTYVTFFLKKTSYFLPE